MRRARDNPFAVERVRRLRYRFRDDDWPSWLSRLKSQNYRGAIVGPNGSGKTTLLEDLAEQLVACGFRVYRLFLNEADRAYPTDFVRRWSRSLGERDIILFDGCEQLGRLSWWRFRWQMRCAGGLVITTHRPCRLPTLWRCETSPELLSDLIGQLCDPTPSIASDKLRGLFEKHRGNVRDVIRELYDLAAYGDSIGSNALTLDP